MATIRGYALREGVTGMDRTSLFFAFYSLILGLAITEILSGFGRFLRSHTTHKLGSQITLLALLTFVSITATWIDAFRTLQSIELDVASLWAPILTATLYYLAATVVFPSSSADFECADGYFERHKRFVASMLFACELLVTYTLLPIIRHGIAAQPQVFVLFYLPLHLVLKGSYVGLLLARRRRWNQFWMALLICVMMFVYWDNGATARIIGQRYASG